MQNCDNVYNWLVWAPLMLSWLYAFFCAQHAFPAISAILDCRCDVDVPRVSGSAQLITFFLLRVREPRSSRLGARFNIPLPRPSTPRTRMPSRFASSLTWSPDGKHHVGAFPSGQTKPRIEPLTLAQARPWRRHIYRDVRFSAEQWSVSTDDLQYE